MLYLRTPSENTRKNVELSELQVPASGLGIENLGFEDKRDEVRLRDAAAGSSKCSVVATASVVIVGGGFGVETESQMEVRDKLRVQRDTSRASREPRHREKPNRTWSRTGFSVTLLVSYFHPSLWLPLLRKHMHVIFAVGVLLTTPFLGFSQSQYTPSL